MRDRRDDDHSAAIASGQSAQSGPAMVLISPCVRHGARSHTLAGPIAGFADFEHGESSADQREQQADHLDP